MKYETICADNRKLYGELEALTLALKELHPIYHESEHRALMARKVTIGFYIEHNLETLEAIWSQAHEVGEVLKRKAARDVEEIGFKTTFPHIISLYVKNPNRTQKEIALEVGVAESQVSRSITAYLVRKYA